MESNEKEFYPILKQAFQTYFTDQGFSCDFEITARRRKSLERFLGHKAILLKHRKELPLPDLMGFIWRPPKAECKLVVAEFKPSPKYRSIFQIRGYDELFEPDLAYLVGAQSISESSMSTIEFIRSNTELLKSRGGESTIYPKVLFRTSEGIMTMMVLGSEGDLPDDHEKLLRY